MPPAYLRPTNLPAIATRHDFHAECSGKVAHSRPEAQRAVRKIGHGSAYRCAYCRHWHTTWQPKK